jgi:hypothetical protein
VLPVSQSAPAVVSMRRKSMETGTVAMCITVVEHAEECGRGMSVMEEVLLARSNWR